MKHSVTTIITVGNTDATKNPSFKVAPLDISPTSQGPSEHPRSPAAASMPNIGAPPFSKRADAILKAPGHIILTDKPHTAQKITQPKALGISAIPR